MAFSRGTRAATDYVSGSKSSVSFAAVASAEGSSRSRAAAAAATAATERTRTTPGHARISAAVAPNSNQVPSNKGASTLVLPNSSTLSAIQCARPQSHQQTSQPSCNQSPAYPSFPGHLFSPGHPSDSPFSTFGSHHFGPDFAAQRFVEQASFFHHQQQRYISEQFLPHGQSVQDSVARGTEIAGHGANFAKNVAFEHIDSAVAASGTGQKVATQASSKRTRRRVATMAQRRLANIRERRRMCHLNTAIDKLRKKVPTFAYEKRLPRIDTIRLAIMYIKFMTELLQEDKDCDVQGTGMGRLPLQPNNIGPVQNHAETTRWYSACEAYPMQ